MPRPLRPPSHQPLPLTSTANNSPCDVDLNDDQHEIEAMMGSRRVGGKLEVPDQVGGIIMKSNENSCVLGAQFKRVPYPHQVVQRQPASHRNSLPVDLLVR